MTRLAVRMPRGCRDRHPRPSATARTRPRPAVRLTSLAAPTTARASRHSKSCTVARPELGTKRVCPTTGRKFYDLNRDPIVSPYTGEELPRTSLEPPTARGAAARARPREVEEEEVEAVPTGPETVSLEEVSAGEEEVAGAIEDDAVLSDEAAGEEEDTFLEEEEEGGDVSDLIDGDIEDDEEG